MLLTFCRSVPLPVSKELKQYWMFSHTKKMATVLYFSNCEVDMICWNGEKFSTNVLSVLETERLVVCLRKLLWKKYFYSPLWTFYVLLFYKVGIALFFMLTLQAVYSVKTWVACFKKKKCLNFDWSLCKCHVTFHSLLSEMQDLNHIYSFTLLHETKSCTTKAPFWWGYHLLRGDKDSDCQKIEIGWSNS